MYPHTGIYYNDPYRFFRNLRYDEEAFESMIKFSKLAIKFSRSGNNHAAKLAATTAARSVKYFI